MADRRERSGDMGSALLAFGEGLQSSIWTAMPGIIQSFDRDKKTCVVQPALRAQIERSDGSTEWVDLPLLLDCPVQFPGGGGVWLTFPLKKDDECLVVFASRCIDAWWQSGGTQNQAELRMHDMSDGFCIPGISSLPKVPALIHTTRAELRSHDGAVHISLDPTTQAVGVTTPGSVTVTAGSANVNTTGNATVSAAGTLTLSGATVNITGTLNINGAPYLAHKHSNVSNGPDQSGGVV